MPIPRRPARLACVAALVPLALGAQPRRAAPPAAAASPLDSGTAAALTFRLLGPSRGGRSTAVTGVAGDPHRFYMGSTGGGVWVTDDAGTTWRNISDGFFGGSIGAIDVADSDPNVIYVGTGSADIRGNSSTGRGVWKSTDAGKTWRFAGLRESGAIGRIVVHPTNPDVAWLAALGHPFGKNTERGVYRTKDGGATWQRVLYLNDSTGAIDVAVNPRNPRILYAGMWRAERKPWTMISGGPEGGVYKSTDGGDTWTRLGGGLPTGIVGKVGVTVSAANPDRVWAIVEAEPAGGLYRSDDAGATWTRVNSDNRIRQRAWYYTHVVADPRNEHQVYVLNTSIYRSVDGGKTLAAIDVPHGDTHDLWINPADPRLMVIGDDGGAQVTVNGGRTWSTMNNQPTAEFYDVITDAQFPYRVYTAQQDNTSISLPAWGSANDLHPIAQWRYASGCETGPVALHPDHPEVIYGGCYGGAINRLDVASDERRNVILYPQLQLGQAAKDLKYRFQWVAPILVSRHDRNVVYHASQHVHRTTDGGMTWTTISPDLTTNDKSTQEAAGGPINHDVTGVEIFNTIFALAEDPADAKVLWAGSDDGRVHVTRDGGATWRDVTPPGMPRFATVNRIDASPHAPGRVIVAAHRYRMDDFTPYAWRTDDYGATWVRIADGTNGIPADHPVRVVREDRRRRGLLYAGTEFGLYVSLDDGRRWQPLQRNLPVTPISDLALQDDDLVVATQGRSLWILDDVTPLQQLAERAPTTPAHLFTPRDAVRAARVTVDGSGDAWQADAAPDGALLTYRLAEAATGPVTLSVVDAAGRTARAWSSDSAQAAEWRTPRLKTAAGAHRVRWNLMYPGPDSVPGQVLWGYTGGVKAPPGRYEVRLTVGGTTLTRPLTVRPDPRLPGITAADYEAQFRLAMEVRDSMNAVNRAVATIRAVREQAQRSVEQAARIGRDGELRPVADSLTARLGAVEVQLNQVKSQSGQDPIRHAGQLDNQFTELYGFVTGTDGYISGGPEGRPAAGALTRFTDLRQQWAPLAAALQRVLETDVPAFNALVQRLGVAPVVLPRPKTVM